MANNDPCARCDGYGEVVHSPLRRIVCGFCNGSGLAVEPRFLAACCVCGVKQTREATAWEMQTWLREHLKTHRPKVRTHA